MNENIFIIFSRVRNQIQNPMPVLPDGDINKVIEIKPAHRYNYINIKR